MALFLALAPPPAKAGGGWEWVVTARTLPSGSRRGLRNPSPALPCLRRGGSRTKKPVGLPRAGRGGSRRRPAARVCTDRCVASAGRGSGLRPRRLAEKLAAEAAPTRASGASFHRDLLFWHRRIRSKEHTSELQSLMRISDA